MPLVKEHGLRLVLGTQGLWWVALVVVAGALAATVLIYKKVGGNLNPKRRMLLGFLRIVGFLLLLFAILEPTLEKDIRRSLKGPLIILIDTSQSMSIKDMEFRDEARGSTQPALAGQGSLSRLAVVTNLLTQGEPNLISSLAERADVRLLSFAEKVRELSQRDLFTLKADGQYTSLGDALRQALARLEGQPSSGILLLTDGCCNCGEDPLIATEYVKTAGMPIYAVGLGRPEPKDLAITHFFIKDAIFVDDKSQAQVCVKATGYSQASGLVRLLRSSLPGEEEETRGLQQEAASLRARMMAAQLMTTVWSQSLHGARWARDWMAGRTGALRQDEKSGYWYVSLPQRERGELEEAQKEEFPKAYEELLRLYYMELSKALRE